MLPSYLLTAAAAVVFVLGALHLAYTFSGPKFDPRDAALKQRMQEVTPVITRETTMWRCWIGFNASHSYGALLFGWLYGYLALAQGALLFASPFLLVTGAVVLGAYALLARAYWFSIPYRGIMMACALYALALVVQFA